MAHLIETLERLAVAFTVSDIMIPESALKCADAKASAEVLLQENPLFDVVPIRENGLFVIGVGERKTPGAFVNACNQFIYSENLAFTGEPKRKVRRRKKKEKGQETSGPLPLLIQGFETAAKEEEWTYLATMGTSLRQLDPAFDSRTYGHQKLQSLLKDYPETFVLKQDRSKKPPVVTVALTSQYSRG